MNMPSRRAVVRTLRQSGFMLDQLCTVELVVCKGKPYREQRLMPLLESMRQDCHFGARSLQRTPGVAVTVILTLMLGIGANTVLFSVIFAVLFRPLPYQDADQLVWIGESGNSKRAGYELVLISDIEDW